MTTTKAKSFGIIPIYKDNNGYKILLVKNTKSGQWGLPKGTPEGNEEPIQTAKRELREETGISAVEIPEEPTFSERYSFEENGIKYEKTNLYYICFVNEMIIGNNLDNIDEARWVSFDEARKVLIHEAVINVTKELEKYIKSI